MYDRCSLLKPQMMSRCVLASIDTIDVFYLILLNIKGQQIQCVLIVIYISLITQTFREVINFYLSFRK